MAIALVTGTSTGIGLATAITLGRSGHTVYAGMRNLARAGDLQAVVAKEQLPVSIVQLDVDDDGSVNSAIQQVLAARGHIDVLGSKPNKAYSSTSASGLIPDIRHPEQFVRD